MTEHSKYRNLCILRSIGIWATWKMEGNSPVVPCVSHQVACFNLCLIECDTIKILGCQKCHPGCLIYTVRCLCIPPFAGLNFSGDYEEWVSPRVRGNMTKIYCFCHEVQKRMIDSSRMGKEATSMYRQHTFLFYRFPLSIGEYHIFRKWLLMPRNRMGFFSYDWIRRNWSEDNGG